MARRAVTSLLSSSLSIVVAFICRVDDTLALDVKISTKTELHEPRTTPICMSLPSSLLLSLSLLVAMADACSCAAVAIALTLARVHRYLLQKSGPSDFHVHMKSC